MAGCEDQVSVTETTSRASDAYFVFHKAATTLAYVAALALTIRFFRGRLDLPFAAGCTILSGFWCLITRIKMAHFLQTYFDVFSRLEVVIPASLGILLSFAALFSLAVPAVHFTDGAELLVWIAIIVHYIKNKAKYVKQGYGPVPTGTWVSPPVSEMTAGDLILTNGAVARNLRESVGHAATLVEREDGKYAISSHMDRGCTLEPIANVIGEVRGHYLVLKLAQTLDDDQKKRMAAIAEEMVRENQMWSAKRNAGWQVFMQSLPLSESVKNKIEKLYRCTGYDWFGMFYGRLAPHRWTCIGASLELYKRMGIKTNPYGTGLLGFGTTLFDPIMPVRFLNDPAFRLMMTPKVPEIAGPVLFSS
jgi:hypothetical protein